MSFFLVKISYQIWMNTNFMLFWHLQRVVYYINSEVLINISNKPTIYSIIKTELNPELDVINWGVLTSSDQNQQVER